MRLIVGLLVIVRTIEWVHTMRHYFNQTSMSDNYTTGVYDNEWAHDTGVYRDPYIFSLSEERLLNYLFKGYNPNIIPNHENNQSLRVYLGLAMVQLINIVTIYHFNILTIQINSRFSSMIKNKL